MSLKRKFDFIHSSKNEVNLETFEDFPSLQRDLVGKLKIILKMGDGKNTKEHLQIKAKGGNLFLKHFAL